MKPKEVTLASPNRVVTPKIGYLAFGDPSKVEVNREFQVSVTVKNAAASGKSILKDQQFLYSGG